MPEAVRRQRPTMKDVADRVGVSIKSVSRVLNGEGGVSPATEKRILVVASEIGFRRNDLARTLRRQSTTETIGVMAKHASTRFFDGLILGIEEVAADHGALVLTATTRTAELQQATLRALSTRRVDGIVVMPTGDDHSFLRTEQAAGLPLVFVDRPPIGFDADAVIAANRSGAYAATTHLLAHGHRRVALVGPRAGLFTVAERLAGHQAALVEVSPPAGDLLRLNCDGSADAELATTELLRLPEPPTAVFALSNVCAIGAARALRAAALGHRIALVGFDDFETADLLDPPLTVVAQTPDEIGRQAARRLFSRIAGDDGPAQTIVTPTHLIQRGSGEIVALDSERP